MSSPGAGGWAGRAHREVDRSRQPARQVRQRDERGAGIGPTTTTSSSSTTASPPTSSSYEALDPCKEGEAEKFIWDGDNTYGGKFVTNPSGGLLSKGHPLGAQCTELVWHLPGQAQARQVEGAKIALQHNPGLGGACVVTMYRRD